MSFRMVVCFSFHKDTKNI